MTLDGRLDEDDWVGAQSLILGWDQAHNTGQWYMQAGDETNDGYLDQSVAQVKFLHVGTDIYVGIVSNDSSICKKGDGWEADGLFLNLQDAITSEKTEYKLMYFGDEVGGPAVAEGGVNNEWLDGVSYEFPGFGQTRNDDDDPDGGYSLEAKIPAGIHGYLEGDSVLVGLVIWDMDGYQVADVNSDYVKAWWGNEWGGATRLDWKAIVLSDQTVQLQPDIFVSQTILDFGGVEVNASAEKSFLIRNDGSAELVISDIVSSDAAFKTNFSSAEGTLQPDEELSVIVTFMPDEEKEYSATLTVQNNDEDVEIQLNGTGMPSEGDPPSVVVWEGPVTVDGVLEPIEWDKANGLVFMKDSKDVTGQWYMQAEDPNNDGYTDVSKAVVKFLHQGTDLYISVASDDSSICYWGWESDGLFFKMRYAETQLEEEFLFMYSSQNIGDGAVLGSKLADPAWGTGVSVEVAGGGLSHNNADDPDYGYNMEVVVHLDQLGYENGDIVKIALVIWDMDYAEPKDVNSDYFKTWWGSEWGGTYRDLILAVSPEAIHAPTAAGDIACKPWHQWPWYCLELGHCSMCVSSGWGIGDPQTSSRIQTLSHNPQEDC